MLRRFFGMGRDTNRAVVDALYERIVAAARRPVYYEAMGADDTPLGRFEMLSLHMFLFLHRARGRESALRDIAQELTDEFFRDVDHSLRELGIGDMGIPKRMKKLARMFYGRAASYGGAIEAGDRAALAAALRRNMRPDGGEWPQIDALADHVLAMWDDLQAQDDADLAGGAIVFAEPAQGKAAA
jgi:cytochrome b pre-mRNA-processing protein 3